MRMLRTLIILALSGAILSSCLSNTVSDEPVSETTDSTPLCDINEAYALLSGCISLDGSLLFISGRQRTSESDHIFVIDLRTLSIVNRLEADGVIFTIALSPNEYQLAAGSNADKLWIWDTGTWNQILEIESTDDICSLAYDHRGWSLFFTGPNTMPYELLSFYPEKQAQPLSDKYSDIFEDAIFILAANPVDGHLATGGKYGWVKYWQTSESNQSNKILWENKISSSDILGLAFSNEGDRLFSANTSGLVDVFDNSSGSNIHSLDANSEFLYWLTTDIRDEYLYAASSSGNIFVWDLETYQRINTAYKAHDNEIQSIVADPLNRFIITAGFSNRIIFHEPITLKTMAEIYLFEDALVAVTPDGYYTGEGNYEQYISSGTNNRENVIRSLQ